MITTKLMLILIRNLPSSDFNTSIDYIITCITGVEVWEWINNEWITDIIPPLTKHLITRPRWD